MKPQKNLIPIWLLCAAMLQAVSLQAATTVTNIVAGFAHSLFIKSDGSLWGMGYNASGQLGDGTFNNTNRPEQIVSSNVVAIAGGYYHSLFLKSDGSLWAMGDDASGQLGDGITNPIGQGNGPLAITNKPEQIISSGVIAIAAGGNHSLLLKSDGSLWAMGNNQFGQLGDGTLNSTNRPEQIVSNGVTAIACGQFYSLFLKSDCSLWGMGANNYGGLGDGTFNNTNLPEEIISNGVIAVAAEGEHSLFIKSGGSLWAMGQNIHPPLGKALRALDDPVSTWLGLAGECCC